MEIKSTTYTVADLCQAMERKEITVNKDYQRSEKVWPGPAKSFLIESILLGYPVPKLLLRPVTDVVSRTTRKEIIDGQQRSNTVFQFFQNKLKLSKRSEIEEAGGKSYNQLDQVLQHRFLHYALSIDLFVSATEIEIRETFRRINSYTVPLNPEEQRHAEFPGPVKWLSYEQSREYDQNLLEIGVFTQKQLIRMADAKLFSEVVHAMIHGIRTTKAVNLRQLYDEFDATFPRDQEVAAALKGAMSIVLSLPEIHDSALMKQHVFYSLLLAIIQVRTPQPALNAVCGHSESYLFNRDVVIDNLTSLAAALDEPEVSTKYSDFVAASTDKTNVAEQRERRVRWLCRALQPKPLQGGLSAAD